MSAPLLEVKHLSTEFALNQAVVHAVNDVSFSVGAGEVLGIVGELGCGKSVMALSVMRLITAPGHIREGEVILHDELRSRDLLQLSKSELATIRGNQISMVFQDPLTSLNPVLSVGFQIIEPLKIHRGMNQQEATRNAQDLLEQVGIPKPNSG